MELIIASGITRVVFAKKYAPDYNSFNDAPWIETVCLEDKLE